MGANYPSLSTSRKLHIIVHLFLSCVEIPMPATPRWFSLLSRQYQRLGTRFRAQPDSAARPTYVLVTWAFLRLLGVVYVIAFGSLWLQIDGLTGREGIVPIA